VAEIADGQPLDDTAGWWTPALEAAARSEPTAETGTDLLPLHPFLAWLAAALGPVRLAAAPEGPLAASLLAAGLVVGPDGPPLALDDAPQPVPVARLRLSAGAEPAPPDGFLLPLQPGLRFAAPPGLLQGPAAALLAAACDPAEARRIAALFCALGERLVLERSLAGLRALAKEAEAQRRTMAQEIDEARRALARAEGRAAQEAARRRAIEDSTIWRSGQQVAALLNRNPAVSRLARRGARLAWHRVLRPLLARRAAAAAVPQIGPEAALGIAGVGTLVFAQAPMDTTGARCSLVAGGRRTEAVAPPAAPASNRADRPPLVLFFPGDGGIAPGTALEIALPDGSRSERPLPAAVSLTPRAAIAAMLGRFAPEADGAEALLRSQLLPAVRACWAAIRREPVKVAEATHGTPPATPEVSIIVPLYGRVDWLLIQAALFADDPDLLATAELIYVLDDPDRAAETAKLAALAHEVYGVPFRLLTLSRNCGYSGANNAGARAARAPRLLLLNSDVLPLRPGWLGRLLEIHRGLPEASALGCRLLFDDGTLQHAGMVFTPFPTFHAWLCDHPMKGLPAALDAEAGPRQVPAVTGACLLVGRDAWQRVGGLTEDYVIGDFEDADLCHKLLAAGGEIWYTPDVALTHLERQSIGLLGEPGWRYGLTLCNMLIHAERWGDRLQALAPLPVDDATTGPDR